VTVDVEGDLAVPEKFLPRLLKFLEAALILSFTSVSSDRSWTSIRGIEVVHFFLFSIY
jgi:hypothetical protein